MLNPIDIRSTIYLRPEAVDVISLTASAELAGAPRTRAAGAAMMLLDTLSRDAFTLSWEGLLGDPHRTLLIVAARLSLRLPDDIGRVIESEIVALRADVAQYRHPIAFVAGLRDAQPDVAWVDNGLYGDQRERELTYLLRVETPRSLLLVTHASQDTTAIPIHGDWSRGYLDLADGMSLSVLGEPKSWGIIALCDIEKAPGLDALLDTVLPHLAAGGLLHGKEHSESAVGRTVASLTGGGDRHDLTFLLANDRWLATSAAGDR